MAAGGRSPALLVDIVDQHGHRQAVRGLAAWLRSVAPARARGAVTIVLVSDTRMRALNRTYRGKDYATDVLSFGAGMDPRRTIQGRKGGRGRKGRKGRKSGRLGATTGAFHFQLVPPIQPIPPVLPIQPIHPFPPVLPSLGDIVIARGVARRQAVAAGHTELDELRLLALHGLLHLVGYDHERDNGLMRRVERRLRRKGGLREGLIERAAE